MKIIAELETEKIIRLKPYENLREPKATMLSLANEIDLFPIELNFNGFKQLLQEWKPWMESEEYPLAWKAELLSDELLCLRNKISAPYRSMASALSFFSTQSLNHHHESYQMFQNRRKN